MHKAIAQRKAEQEAMKNLALRYVQRLKTELGPLTAVLVGSVARGDFNRWSDIDVLIISDVLPAHPLKRMDLLYRSVEGGIEPKGYTRQQYLRMLLARHPWALDAVEHGILLMDDGFWSQVRGG